MLIVVQRSKYDELGNDKNLATVRVLVPEDPMGEWQVMWTIKRQRDPNGRKSFPSGLLPKKTKLTRD